MDVASRLDYSSSVRPIDDRANTSKITWKIEASTSTRYVMEDT